MISCQFVVFDDNFAEEQPTVCAMVVVQSLSLLAASVRLAETADVAVEIAADKGCHLMAINCSIN